MAHFKAGDQVELKSGGPVMTVEAFMHDSFTDSMQYKCSWFAGEKIQSAFFVEAALKAA